MRRKPPILKANAIKIEEKKSQSHSNRQSPAKNSKKVPQSPKK